MKGRTKDAAARDKTDKTDKTPAATSITRAVNEWGIPDWRDAGAYGDVKRWTFNRWRWEFYRRRDDLRAYFDARAEETYQYWQRFAGKPHFPAAPLRPDACPCCQPERRKGQDALTLADGDKGLLMHGLMKR